MTLRINKKLNLIIPVFDPPAIEKDERTGKDVEVENVRCYVHSTPIQRETFERYYLVIGQAFNQIHVGGLGILSGARLAALVVRDIAMKSNTWDGEDGVENGLINEIVRLTNVFTPSPRGWAMVPFEEAVRAELISEDDAAEVKNAIVFFTLTSTMVKRDDLAAVMTMALRIWGGRLEPLSCSEFQNSLPTSKGTANSGAKTPEGSSVPS